MKTTVLFLAFASAALAQIGTPMNDFKTSMVFTMDTTVGMPEDQYSSIGDNIPRLMQNGLTMEEATNLRHMAEAYFRDRFGVDFTNVVADSTGTKMLNGIMEQVGEIVPAANYRVLASSNKKYEGMPITDVFVGFTILQDGVMLHGTYGGPEGMPAMMGQSGAYGYYVIPANTGNTKLKIHYASDTAMPMSMDGDMPVRCFVNSDQLGTGYEMGIQTMTMMMNGRMHLFTRTVLTFPDTSSMMN